MNLTVIKCMHFPGYYYIVDSSKYIDIPVTDIYSPSEDDNYEGEYIKGFYYYNGIRDSVFYVSQVSNKGNQFESIFEDVENDVNEEILYAYSQKTKFKEYDNGSIYTYENDKFIYKFVEPIVKLNWYVAIVSKELK